MFPLRDENPTLHRSVATFVLIGVNIAVWILAQGFGSAQAVAASVARFGVIPGELLGRVEPGTRVPLGPDHVLVITGTPNWLTLLTSMFMHGGWFHLLGNMWFLSIFGDNVEDAMGAVRYTFFYLLCCLAAAAAQIMANPSSPVPMVGASGAISGVMGAYALLYPKAPVEMLVYFGFYVSRVVVPAVFMLGYWFLLQFVGGALSAGSDGGGVAFWAHAGGFLAGIVLVRLFCNPHRLAACRGRRGRVDHMVRRLSPR
ncbi:MAG: rhomboid family intramembrane serine protease [Kiritimatiellae bacterium]|nr:rhomboid family intramembrane serine protease [Kiritimatiellia bacterium]